MTRSLFGGSAAIAALIASIFVFDAGSSQAVTPQQQASNPANTASASRPRMIENLPYGSPETKILGEAVATETVETETFKSENSATAEAEAETFPVQHFTATAYSLRGRTATGQYVRRGIIAADRRLLPLGTRVRLKAGAHSGEYLVADTGGAVRGNKIDIWVPSTSEAMRFGRRRVQLTVLQYPRKAANRTRPRTVANAAR